MGQTSRNGADVPAAIREFRAAGWTVAQIADDMAVHRSTVYRWAAGTRRPNVANFTELVELIDARYAQENGRHAPRPGVLLHLQAAHEALYSTEKRARADAIAAELGARFAERDREQEQAEEDAYQARQARRIARQRTSITGRADVFDVINSGRPAEVPMFGAVA